MKNYKILFLMLFITNFLTAQDDPFHTQYQWDQNPEYQINSDNTEDILELKTRVVTEFLYDRNGNLVEYFLQHRVLWLNSDNAIENYNRIYLPYSGSSELVVSKARVITEDGSILEMKNSDIYTAKDEETGREVKYFAFNGIDKGSFIEYYYVEKRDPQYNGNRIFLQSSIDRSNIGFDLFAPKNLIFKFKTYNGLPEVALDTVQDKLHWSLCLEQLAKLEKEELSAFDASRAAVIYKLDQNLANNLRNIISYGEISQNIYSIYYPEHSKRTSKKLERFLKENLSSTEKGHDAIIRELEFFIKNNVYYTEGNSNSLSDLEEVLEKKIANEAGMVKLYTALLDALKINHQLVLTTNRQDLKFDKEFEAVNFLTDFLIYFPETKKFLSPIERASRYGFPPAYLTDNYGLFVNKITIGNLTTGMAEVKYIEPVSADKTFDKMLIQVTFAEEDPATINVDLDRGMNGYYAMYVHPFMHLVKDDERKELIESFATNLDEGADIVSQEVINADPELFGVKPLRFHLNFNSDAFMQKAGNKYIFKVGELIGQQIELYQEKERVLPLENEFKRSYYRTLTIDLPEGYEVVNPEDIVIQKIFRRNGEILLSFDSNYTIDAGVLTITADEHYNTNIIGTAHYDDYRSVINSAADFNKINLVLEPVAK